LLTLDPYMPRRFHDRVVLRPVRSNAGTTSK
jgi:hypothetical protein